MNITEANTVNTLLDYVLGTPGPAGPVTSDKARQAAEVLADRAYKALTAGHTADHVRRLWPDRRS